MTESSPYKEEQAPGESPQNSSLFFHPSLFLFWLGQALTQISDGIIRVALLWFVYELTGSAFKMALVGTMEALPVIFLGTLAGPFLDYYDKKRVIIGANLLRFGLTLSLPLLFWMNLLNFPVLCLGVGLIATASAFFGSALTASIPWIVPRERLKEANSLLYTSIHGGLLLGPAFAGGLIPILGSPLTLCLTASLLLVSALCFLPVTTGRAVFIGSSRSTIQGFFEDLSEGLRLILFEDRIVLSVMAVAIAYNFSLNPLPLVFSAFSERVFSGGARVMGLMMSCFGAGALLTSFLLANIRKDLGDRTALGVSMGIAGLILVVLGHSHSLLLACLLALLTGSCASTMGVLFLTILQKRSPQHLLGRVLSTFNAITQSATPLGMMVAGGLLDSQGIAGTLLCLGLTLFVVGAVVLSLCLLNRQGSLTPPLEAQRGHA